MSGICSEQGKTHLFEEGMAYQRAGRRSVVRHNMNFNLFIAPQNYNLLGNTLQ